MTKNEQIERLRSQLAVLAAYVSDLPVPLLPENDPEMQPWMFVAVAVADSRSLLYELAYEAAS